MSRWPRWSIYSKTLIHRYWRRSRLNSCFDVLLWSLWMSIDFFSQKLDFYLKIIPISHVWFDMSIDASLIVIKISSLHSDLTYLCSYMSAMILPINMRFPISFCLSRNLKWKIRRIYLRCVYILSTNWWRYLHSRMR
jgi:hypothetical protein